MTPKVLDWCQKYVFIIYQTKEFAIIRTYKPKKGFWFPKSLLYKESRTLDMNKLRMTGFECFATFVIRRAKHTPKGAARHWQQELCLGIEINLMSFPIEKVRLNSFVLSLFLNDKYR